MGISHAEHRRVKIKTASYQIVEKDLGVYFNNVGASGAVTLTLPDTDTIQDGWWCEGHACVLAQNFIVASYGSSDNIVTFNDIAADSITWSTANEIAGAGWRAIWDATSELWMFDIFTEETQTTTVA